MIPVLAWQFFFLLLAKFEVFTCEGDEESQRQSRDSEVKIFYLEEKDDDWWLMTDERVGEFKVLMIMRGHAGHVGGQQSRGFFFFMVVKWIIKN